jgi:hypothetical protein
VEFPNYNKVWLCFTISSTLLLAPDNMGTFRMACDVMWALAIACNICIKFKDLASALDIVLVINMSRLQRGYKFKHW